MSKQTRSAQFMPAEIAKQLPEYSNTILADEFLTDRPEASCRVFRAYNGVKPHFHKVCDEVPSCAFRTGYIRDGRSQR